MERQRENWRCVHDIRLVTITDHGGTHWRVLSIIRSSSKYIGVACGDGLGGNYISAIFFDWNQLSYFSLRKEFLGFTGQKRIPHTRRQRLLYETHVFCQARE